MELEKTRSQPGQFDVLAVDAFSSDAIPVHLFTRECYQDYWYHLKEDGMEEVFLMIGKILGIVKILVAYHMSQA